MNIYIAVSDNREDHPTVLGAFASDSDAYARLGRYHRENNDADDMESRWFDKSVCQMSDEELGRAQINQGCIFGEVWTHPLIQSNVEM